MLTINTNTTSLMTQRQMHLSSNALKTSIERLSAGFKINRAADNASNLSISKKMGTQLSGTKVAQENAQQAIALLDTADGALDEMTSIANRIRDLSLQSMNGTYSEKERSIMQKEVNKLTLELYRQRNSTKYNKMNIFGEVETQAQSGILGGGATSNSGIATVSAVNDISTAEKPYKAELEYLESTRTQWIDTGVAATITTELQMDVAMVGDFTPTLEPANTVLFGVSESLDTKFSMNFGGGSLQNKTLFCWLGNQGVSQFTIDEETLRNRSTVTLKSGYASYGDYSIALPQKTQNNTDSIYLFGCNKDGNSVNMSAYDMRVYSTKIYDNGELVRDYIPVVDNIDVACLYDRVTKQCYYNQGTGDFVAGPVTYVVPEPPPPPPFSIDLQIGANSGENNMLNVELGFSLGGFQGDVTTIESASDTLNAVDELKKTLNEKRSEIGVSRNRIDGIIESQSIKIENLSASHSTIVDTDFAKESATLVRSQILQQATSSLLKQANITQQLALQLLQ